MTFEDARAKIMQALDASIDIYNKAELGGKARDTGIDLTFAELELDSLDAVECCMKLEEDIGIDIDPADLAIHDFVNRLAEYIVQRTGAA